MKLRVQNQNFFETLTTYFSTVIRFLLNVLLIIIILAIGVGVVKSGIDLATSLNRPLEYLLEHILLDVIFIMALIEVSIIILGYLKDGYVHIRYVVDTILIIMMNEVIAAWFEHPNLQEMIGLAIIIATLAAVRITTVKFTGK